MKTSFWNGKKVFVTGHTGFKGGWLCLWLQELGAKVTGYSLAPSSHPNFFKVAEVEDNMNSIIGDIRDKDKLESILISTKPEIVFHLAAQPLVRRSYVDPVETYTTNIMGTINLFEGIRKVESIRSIVNVTTDKCYVNKEWYWGYRENEALGGIDPYSSSKACSEIITNTYRTCYFDNENNTLSKKFIGSARAGNVIGGGDWSIDRIVPDIINSITNNTILNIRSPNSIRPWQHVLSPLSGYLLLAEKLYSGEKRFSDAFNFGPSDTDCKTVKWIVKEFSNQWCTELKSNIDSTNHPHEANILKLDSTKANSLLGWKPAWNIEESINSIVNWHKAYLNNENKTNMKLQSINQIKNYSSKLLKI